MNDKIKTTATVTKVKRCWWFKVNTKALRTHALQDAKFPHIIYFEYNAEGELYSKKKFLHYNITCPNVNDKIEVYYDAGKPTKISLCL